MTWDPSFKEDKYESRVQCQAGRFCILERLLINENYSDRNQTFKDLEWDTLHTRRKQLCMMYKMEKGLVDIHILDYSQVNI